VRTRSENIPKACLSCCQIATILATVAGQDSDGVCKPEIKVMQLSMPLSQLIQSGNCNKTANINVKKSKLKQQKSKRCYYLGAR